MTGSRKRPGDPNQLAKAIVAIATGEQDDHPKVAERASSGAKGGSRRAAAITVEQRAEAARLAAQARWRRKSD
jgi:hypothetical protein